MGRILYKLALHRSEKKLIERHSEGWYQKFVEISDEKFSEIMPRVPDIGKSIFSFNYKFAPCYIAWYLALKEMDMPANEIDETIWLMNERLVKIIPGFLMHRVGCIYFNSFRKQSAQHMKKQETVGVHPYDWKIKYRDISDNCFEIDILSCGMKRLAEDFGAEGMLPGICRMDYMYANIMGNGFERTKTLGDGDECCNCRYFMKGDCEWAPEKGFVDRK